MTLTEKAIAAYEASSLRRQDLKKSEALLSKIQHFLALFDIKDVKVDSNPFEIDGLRLYVDPMEDVDGIFGYMITISRQCPRCKADLTFEVTVDSDAALIGRWLSEVHPCEFKARKRAGF